jgi:hypothetical protein
MTLRAALGIAMLCSAAAAAEPTKAVRGLASQVEIDYGARLKARAEQSPLSPILVRVSDIAGTSRKRMEFIGTVSGNFDLRDFLEREDGRPLDDLAAIPVSIASNLPPGHGTDLYSSGDAALGWRVHYRAILWIVVALWVAVPIVYLIVRAMRKPKALPPAPVAAPPITIADQLRAALESAGSRPLSVEERGQLELLVFRYFGERLGRPETSDPAETLRIVRDHAETRELVTAIERWLHAFGGESDRERAAAALEEFRRSRLSGSPSPCPLPEEGERVSLQPSNPPSAGVRS